MATIVHKHGASEDTSKKDKYQDWLCCNFGRQRLVS